MIYIRAETVLPDDLIEVIIKKIPTKSQKGLLIYISGSFYRNKRNTEIRMKFCEYCNDDTKLGTYNEIYDELAEEFSLCPRTICNIVKEERLRGIRRKGKRVAQYSGIRVTRKKRK